MARVHLLTATPEGEMKEVHLAPYRALRRGAALDRFGVHSLTEDSEEADVILFVESYGAGWHFERVRAHPWTRRYREKCFLFCANPYVIPFLPGIYTGLDRRWHSRRTISGFYPALAETEFLTFDPPSDESRYLFSFMGSTLNAPVRRRLAAVEHPRGFFQDTTAEFQRVLHGRMAREERRDYHRRYAEVTKASKFVLCPRGLSVSSIRLFETMRMGRVPVILSDGWVEPPGPAWSEFSIRVPETSCANLPRLLEAREHEAAQMGARARSEWLQWFSEEVAFHRVTEWCLQIRDRRRVREQFARWPVFGQYVRPFHLRRFLGAKARRVREVFAPTEVLVSEKTAESRPVLPR